MWKFLGANYSQSAVSIISTHCTTLYPISSLDLQVQELHENGKRIKIEASIAGPLIKIPTHSKSEQLVTISLGELSLSNSFRVVEKSDITRGLPPVYEKFEIKLTAVEVFRFIWNVH